MKYHVLILTFILSGFSTFTVFGQKNPNSVNDLAFWICGDSIPLNNGDKIDQIASIIDAFPIVYQAEPNYQPTLLTNSLNTHATILFDGTDDFLDGGGGFSIDNNGQTFFIVAKSTTSNAAYYAKTVLANQPNRYAVLYAGGGILSQYHDVDEKLIEGTNNNGSFEIVTNIINYNNASFTLFQNGIYQDERAIISPYNATSSWNFLLGAYNNSAGGIPPVAGFYLNGEIAEVIIYDRPLTQLERQDIENYLRLKYFPSEYRPPVDLGADITMNDLTPVTLTVPSQPYYVSYEWNTGATTDNILVEKSGEYSVVVTDDRGYIYLDTIQVTVPDIYSINDTTICNGESLIWDCGLNGAYTYDWSNGESTQAITITQAGTYSVDVYDASMNVKSSNIVSIQVNNYENEASLGPDIDICDGNFIELTNKKSQTVKYKWSSGTNDTLNKIYPILGGEYSVIATDTLGCIAYDTIIVSILGTAPDLAFNVTDICYGDDTEFDNKSTGDNPIIDTKWVFGTDTIPGDVITRILPSVGEHTVRMITTTDVGCVGILDSTIYIAPLPVADFIPPRACTLVETDLYSTSTLSEGAIQFFTWTIKEELETGDYTSTIFDTAGFYPVKLKVTTDYNCVDDTTKLIEVREAADIQFVHNKTCQGEYIYFFDKTKFKPENYAVAGFWIVDGVPDSYIQGGMINEVFNVTGNHTVELAIKTLNGCINSKVENIYVHPKPTMDSIEFYGCFQQPISLLDEFNTYGDELTGYIWNIDSLGEYTEASPTVLFKNKGDYGFTLNVETDKECLAEGKGIIHVQDPPVADFEFSPTFGAAPLLVEFTNTSIDGATYFWRFEEGDYSNEEEPSHTFTILDSSYATLYTYSSFNCVDSITKHVPIDLAYQELKIVDFSYTINERGYYEYKVQVANAGNSPIHRIEFILNNPETTEMTEIWEGTIPFHGEFTYTFVAHTKQMSNNGPAFMCVKANIIADETSLYKIYDSDTLCKDFAEDFKIYTISPNPVTENLNVTFTTNSIGDVVIECINQEGKILKTYSFTNLEAGIYTKKIETEFLRSGSYFLHLKQGNREDIMPFLKVSPLD